MRHDAIHPMACGCERCASPLAPSRYHEPVIDPADLGALRKGIIVGLWAGGLIAASQYAPTIADWFVAQ